MALRRQGRPLRQDCWHVMGCLQTTTVVHQAPDIGTFALLPAGVTGGRSYERYERPNRIAAFTSADARTRLVPQSAPQIDRSVVSRNAGTGRVSEADGRERHPGVNCEQVRSDVALVGPLPFIGKVLPTGHRASTYRGATVALDGEEVDRVVPHGVVESDFFSGGDQPASDEVGGSAVVDTDSAVGVAGVIDLRPQTGQPGVLPTTNLSGMGVVPFHTTLDHPDHHHFAGTEALSREYTFASPVRRGAELAALWFDGDSLLMSRVYDVGCQPTPLGPGVSSGIHRSAKCRRPGVEQ